MVKQIEIDINADEIIRELRGIGELTNKALSAGINNAAFGLRKFWIADMNVFLHRPSFFTKKVFVRKSKPDNLIAITLLPKLQAEYLSKVIDGGIRRPGDYATLNGQILSPVNARLNKLGNFPRSPKRWLATVEEKIKGSFVGSPGGPDSDNRKAVYKRLKNNKLKLLAIFVQTVEYDKQLPLEKTTETYAPAADQAIQKQLERFLK